MSRRTFAVWAVALVLVFQAQTTEAQVKPITIDGCAKLARVIYSEVSAAALYGPKKSGPWSIDLGQGDLAICDHAAKTVSRAFTSAMMSAGIDVFWGREEFDNAGYCWSGFLAQCYPDRSRVAYSSVGGDADFVRKSWSVVSQAVMREMFNPYSSDEVRFRDGDLKLRLGLSLRSVGARDVR
jgi:hypothetical protein